MSAVVGGTPAPAPPFRRLRDPLLAQADALAAAGQAGPAAALRQTVESWWHEQERWNEALAQVLGLNHDINNALVGVRGNVQLLMMAPIGREAGVRERLEVMLRESGRIREAAARLHDFKSALVTPEKGQGGTSRAA